MCLGTEAHGNHDGNVHKTRQFFDTLESDLENDSNSETSSAITSAIVNDELEQIGFGKFQVMLFILCGLGWMSDASEGSVLSFLIPQLRAEWGISTEEAGDLASASAAGQALGSVFFGLCADYLGRRPTFITTVFLSAVLGAATAFVPTYHWLLPMRFFAGAAFGGNLPLAISMITEMIPQSSNTRCLILLQLFMEAGGLSAAVYASLVMPDWKLFVLLSALPATVAVCFVWMIPESPHYLLSVGRHNEARRVLNKIATFNGKEEGFLESMHTPLKVEAVDVPVDKAVVHEFSADEVLVQTAHDSNTNHDEAQCLAGILLQPNVRRSVVALGVAWFAAQLGSGWYVWVVDIAQRVGLSSVGAPLMIAARVVVSVSFLLVSEFVARMPASDHCILGISIVGVAIGSGMFTISVCVYPLPWAFCGSFLVYAFMFGSAWPLLYAVTAKSFPTNVRTTGISFASACSKLGSVIQPQIAGHLLDNHMLWVGIIASCSWMLVLVGVLMVPKRANL